MTAYTVKSWNDLMDVFGKDAEQFPLIGRHRSDNVYRGLSDANWELETSLQRVNPSKFVKLERHLLRNFIKYAPQNSVVFNNFWNWLTLAQHHGLPTRLMDWTYSPLIALHFALDNYSTFNNHSDAIIWSVNLESIKSTLPKPVKKEFDKDGAYTFSISRLNSVWKELENLNSNSRADFLIFFEPPSFDDRIINQYALLSTTRNPRTIVSEWLTKHPKVYKKTIIPNKFKWEFRDRLDQMNITERITYPGLDGLCSWLKRWYCKAN